MMNVLNGDPEALQDPEMPSESSVKGAIWAHKICAPWFHCGSISWENEKNFLLKRDLLYRVHWTLWFRPDTCLSHLPAFTNFHICSIDQKTNEELKPGYVYSILILEYIPSSSGNYTEIPCTLSLSESSTDEEEEFLDKQQVIILPWLKNTSWCFVLFSSVSRVQHTTEKNETTNYSYGCWIFWLLMYRGLQSNKC